MIFDALHIAGSSLTTNQKTMDVVSHNIANVNTPGYSRQTSQLATKVPEAKDNLIFGRGVDLQSISRQVDPLIDLAQRENNSQREFYRTLTQGLGVVENVFGSLQSTGLTAALDDFFLSWQQLANNPQDPAQKYNVRSKSEIITNTLDNMHQQLVDAQANADSQIDEHVANANQILTEIASLSRQIRQQESAFGGQVSEANDLRDSRDQLVRDLSAIIPIQQVATSDGGLLLQTLGGDMLLHNDTARQIQRSAAAGATGFSQLEVVGSGQVLTGLDQGGSIGGLIELRDNKFGSYLTQLDSIATNLVFAINQLHSNGTGSSRMSSFTSGQGASNPALALDDAAQLNTFASQIQTGSFTVHLYDAAGTPTPAGGTTIAVTAGVTTMNDIATAINGVAGVTASVDVAGRLVVDAGANTLGFGGDTSNFLAAYEINSLFHGSGSGGLTISAEIAADPGKISVGTLNPTTSLTDISDNTTAIAIMNLQNIAISYDGSTALSMHERTSALSTQYGTDFAIADQQRIYRETETESLAKQRQAVSGVNVDEELVEMIKFQRAYEASAKVISTTNLMLDSLMGMLR